MVYACKSSGRNTCQMARALEAPSRMAQTQHRTNSAGLLGVLALAGRCSDHNQGISPPPGATRAVSHPPAPAAFPSRKIRAVRCRRLRGCGPEGLLRAILSTTPPRETRFLKTSVADGGSNLHRNRLVLRAIATRCFVPWQILGPVRRATIPSGFSLRSKSPRSCAKG